MKNKINDKFIADMDLHGYAKRTKQSYLRAVRQLENFWSRPADELSEEEVREYFLYCKNELGWRSNTLRIAYSGIKFLYVTTLESDWRTLKLLKTRHVSTLPTVLDIDDVTKIISTMKVAHVKAFYTMVYSTGMRLSEALHIQPCDIDGKRMMIHVRGGKGAKDRYVPLPGVTLLILREYWKTHRNPNWVFPAIGQTGKGAGSATRPTGKSPIQAALRRHLKRIGFKKPVTPHTFRHSYATHLLEANVGIRELQEYMGHANIASTIIYLHLTKQGQKKSIKRIDQLMKGSLS
jgi:site-specific recombinase XerD